jgi:hypothetical protein
MRRILRKTPCLLAVLGFGLAGNLHAAAKEHQYGPIGILGNHTNTAIKVARVAKGSPADGKITPGMEIIGAGESNFKTHVRRELADAIDIAETEKGAGKLTLILKGGKKVDLTLTVLGTYSDTAPYNCPKSAAILKRARITGEGSAKLTFSRLAGMAGQDVLPAGISREETAALKAKRPDTASVPRGRNHGYCTWRWGYALIANCEQYLRKPDEALFSRIRSSAITLAEGQDAGGLYGHQLATPERNGRLPGYAQMNQPSLSIFIGLLLARECGVDDQPVLDAIERAHAFYASFIGKGTLNYGVHGPNTKIFNNNGMSATAAIAMALYGNKEGARFFSQLSAASYDGLETGHGGYFYNVFWTPLGAAVGGPELVSAFFKEARWLYTMYRRWDGTFSFDSDDSSINGSALVMPYTLGNRSLLITGRAADESIWLKGKAATDAVEMGRYDYAKMSTQELLALVNHPIPQVRRRAGWALRDHKDQITPRLRQFMKEGTKYEKMFAVGYFGYPQPSGTGLPYLDDIGAILKDRKEDAWARAAAASSLAWMGEPAKKYYMDMVRLIAEDRPWDRFGDIDWSVGASLGNLSKTPFTDGIVTDRKLFYKAAVKLADNKRQHTRTYGVQMLGDMPKEDFHLVGDTVMHLARNNDPTYHSYHSPGGYVTGAIVVLAKANVEEGIPLTLGMLDDPSGKWSFKLDAVISALQKYGANAKPALEQLKADPRLKTIEENGRFSKAWKAMVKAIEEDKNPRKLSSFEEAKKARKK